jgi:predicted secreted protein
MSRHRIADWEHGEFTVICKKVKELRNLYGEKGMESWNRELQDKTEKSVSDTTIDSVFWEFQFRIEREKAD